MNMTALIGVLFLIGSFHSVRTVELQWSSRVQHGRSFSCPSEQVIFTCTISSATHVWNITSESSPSDTFVVSITSLDLNPISPNMNYSFSGSVNASAQVIVSTATVIATPSIGIINVRCQAPFVNSDDDVQSVQAEFLGATWSFSANDPSSERRLSDLSVNINMDERGRQCVDSFIITDNNIASLNCTGDHNSRTITCPPQNFCEQNMYSLNGSTTTAFSVPPPPLQDHTITIPSDLFTQGPSLSYIYDTTGLMVSLGWKVVDDFVLNRNTVALTGSLSISGQLINEMFINDTAKRFTFNTSQLINFQVADSFSLRGSLTFNNGSCSDSMPYTFTVSNLIRVERIVQGENSVTIRFNQNQVASGLSSLKISYATMCDPQSGTEMPPSSRPVTGDSMVIEFGPQATNCFFTVQLLSSNNERIGFPIGGYLNQSVTPPEPPNGDLSAGAVAGIAVAAVVVALIAVVLIVIIIIYKLKKGKSQDGDKTEWREWNHPASNDATPEGDLYTEVSRDRKPDRPEDHLPTYQAPDTIRHGAAGGGAGGELYTVVDKPKKGGKKANDKSENGVAQLYAMPDKSKKKQNQDQGLVYADIGAGGQAVRRPAPAPQRVNTLQHDTGSVTYSTVQSTM